MEEENALVGRAAILLKGGHLKRVWPDLSDGQILSFLEVADVDKLLELMYGTECLAPSLKLLEGIFEGLRCEINADPPTLVFVVVNVPPTEDEPGTIASNIATPNVPSEEALAEPKIIPVHRKFLDTIRANRSFKNLRHRSSVASFERSVLMAESNPKAAHDAATQVHRLESLGGLSKAPVKMMAAVSTSNSETGAHDLTVKSSASSTTASTNMPNAKLKDFSDANIYGLAVESGTASSNAPIGMTKAKSTSRSHTKVQAKKSLASSSRTHVNQAHPESQDPFGVRVSTNEFGTKPPPFAVLVGEYATTRDNALYLGGVRDATAHFEEINPPKPQPFNSDGVDLTPEPVKAHLTALAAKDALEAETKDADTKELNIVGAEEVITAKGLHDHFKATLPYFGEERSFAAAAAMAQTINFKQPTMHGNYSRLSDEAMKSVHETLEGMGNWSADAPTEDDEAPAKSWIHPVADRVADKAQMHYDEMYGIVTQMQRDRLELGPEVPDYEVIVIAHAGYVAKDKAEAEGLARAAETMKTRALALSIIDELRLAQKEAAPTSTIAGLKLTQEDVAAVLARCEAVGGSCAAANAYIEAQMNLLHVDPFTNQADLNSYEAAMSFDLKELLADVGATFREQNAPGRFATAVSKIEKDLVEMKQQRGRLGTTPRDFSKEIAEIEAELADLKKHRANAPGDLVRDSVDNRDDSAGTLQEEPEKAAAAAAAAAKPKSRAEQRRAAREKAKA